MLHRYETAKSIYLLSQKKHRWFSNRAYPIPARQTSPSCTHDHAPAYYLLHLSRASRPNQSITDARQHTTAHIHVPLSIHNKHLLHLYMLRHGIATGACLDVISYIRRYHPLSVRQTQEFGAPLQHR
jgi:hypothetical protein